MIVKWRANYIYVAGEICIIPYGQLMIQTALCIDNEWIAKLIYADMSTTVHDILAIAR